MGDKSKCNFSDNKPINWSVNIGQTQDSDFKFLFYELSYFVRMFNDKWNNENSKVVAYFKNNENRTNFRNYLVAKDIENRH